MERGCDGFYDYGVRLTEIPDLERGSVVFRDGVDGKMGVDEFHLVEEALRRVSPSPSPSERGAAELTQLRRDDVGCVCDLRHPVRTLVTPMIMFSTNDLIVLRHATCFRAPCQTVKMTTFLSPRGTCTSGHERQRVHWGPCKGTEP